MGRVSYSLSISVLLVISVLWKPAYTDDKCSVGCVGNPSSATFLSGHKYNYAVDGEVSISLSSADRQETSVRVVGQVSVSALGNCAHVLKVKDLSIQGPDNKRYGKPQGLEKPVRFTLQDGRVAPEICAEPGDTRRSLNIKRAIISLLQTEQKSGTQVDVFGSCPTDVVSTPEGGSVFLHKRRDLAFCAHREQSNAVMVNAVLNDDATIKSTMVLHSSLHVESKVVNGIPAKIVANEEYSYKPFAVGENGAKATVQTKLNLINNEAGADAGRCTEPRTIIFEVPHGVKTDQSNLQTALAAVKETANTLTLQASSASAGHFAELIRILRSTNKQDLLNIYTQVRSSQLERRVFLDALFRLGTGYSVSAIVELYKTNQLDNLEKPLSLLAFANARHIDEEALNAAASLLDLQNQPKEIYLGVGSIAGVYCKGHDCHDANVAGIKTISQKFEAKLKSCKPTTKTEEDEVIAVLKGIRNIHHLEDSLIDKLVRSAADLTVKPRVKVAILEAFQADPCSPKIKKTGLDILKNRQLDSEIRIKAYLAVITCPCAKSATDIKTLLDSEPVHQVGRFITSSLRHIRSSANQDKANARQHYGQIRTPKKFHVDDRKYSFYREGSYNIDALGVGGILEETVIYSQDSFLPRSVNFNLTTEVFGHNLNVLEIGARQGNLDRVFEHFFGPKSFLRTEKPQKIYDDLVKRYQETKEQVEKHRGRRSIKTDVDTFDKRIKDTGIQYNNELDLDIYIKLFGSDTVFLSLGDDKGFDFNKALDQLLGFCDDGLDKLKRLNQEFRSHVLFLDTELAYPTSTGLPLKLDLIGSATGRLDVAASVDVYQILRNPESAKLDVKLVPSADVEISGLFLIDADSVITGLKVSSNLHTSTGGHLVAKVLENGQGFDLQFGLPVEKQEILVANSDVVFVTAEKGQKGKQTPLKQVAPQKQYNACFDQLSAYVGLTLCTEASIPVQNNGPDNQILSTILRYPLTSPAKLKIILEKNDLRNFHVKGVLRNSNPNSRSFELLFEAEGARNRHLLFTSELVATDEEKTVKADVEFVFENRPVLQAGAQISAITRPDELSLMVKGKLSPEQEYYGKVGLKTVESSNTRTVYNPLVEFRLPSDREKQSLSINGKLIVERTPPARTKFSIEDVNFKLPDSNDLISIGGEYEINNDDVTLDLKAKSKDHSLTFTGSLYNKRQDLKLEFFNTLNQFGNFRLTGHFESSAELVRNDLELLYSGDLRNQNNRIVLNQLLKYTSGSNENFNFHTDNKFEICSLPFKLNAYADINSKNADIKLGGQYLEKKASLDLDAKSDTKTKGDYTVKFDVDVNSEGVVLFAKRDIVSADKSNVEYYIDVKGHSKYELTSVVLHKTKENDVNVGAVGQFKVTVGSKVDVIKFDFGHIQTEKLFSSHAKVDNQGLILDYLLKVVDGPVQTGELKFVLKNTISANGQFKVTTADGKGNGFVLVDFKQIQRKIKADVSFVVKDPVYDLNVDVYLNFDKDKNEKVVYSTKSRVTADAFDSKNSLDFYGKKTELNFKESGITTPGKFNYFVEVILPTERCLSFKYATDVTDKDDVLNGSGEIVFSDASKSGAAASTITYKSKLLNVDFTKNSIERYEGQLNVKLTNGKGLQNTFYVKNVPEGSKFKFEFKSDLSGNLIPQPASLQASGDYSAAEVIDGVESYQLKGNYGSDYSFEYVGKSEINFISDSEDKKYRDDSTLTVRLPFEQSHDIKVVSNVLIVTPVREDVFAEYTIVESVQVNSELYKVEANGKVGTEDGFGKVKVLIPHFDPYSFDYNYNADIKSDKQSGKVELKTTYGKGKNAQLAIESSETAQEYNLKLSVLAPEKVLDIGQKLGLEYHAKNPTPETFYIQTLATIDNKPSVKSDAQFVLSKSNPVFDIKYTLGTAKPSRIYFKGTSLSSTQGKLDIEIVEVQGLTLVATSEGSVQQDNIDIKFEGNSEKLGLKNYRVEILSKDAGSGKRLEFHATNDNKNILSGSTSLISKQEGQKTIVEGSGSVKVREEQKSATFKYIRTLLTEGNEQGIETFLKLALGDSSYVTESRVTNLEYKYSYLYCEEKEQCANAEIHSKVNIQNPGVLQHILNVGVDLRKLGVTPEFGLEAVSEVSENKFPQYSLDLHINKEEKKYHLHVYSQPEHGNFPAGITITLPTRVLALESQLTYPTQKSLPFPLKGEVALYLDKNKPQTKTSARLLFDASGDSQRHSGVAEIAFSHPKLGKEILLRYNGQVQNPSPDTYKIESNVVLSHPSLGKDLESKLYFEASSENGKLLITTPICEIVDIELRVVKDALLHIETKSKLLNGKELIVRFINRDFEYFEFATGYAEDNRRRLAITAHLEPEEQIDISADIVLPNGKKNIVHGGLYVDGYHVKSDYGVSKENFNYFVNALKNDVAGLEDSIVKLSEQASNELKSTLQKIQPQIESLRSAYVEELHKLYEELADEQLLKQIAESLQEIYTFIAKIIVEINEAFDPIVKKVLNTFKETSEKVQQIYEQQIEPQMKELIANVSALLKEYFDGLIDIVAHFAAIVTDFFEKHKAELEELSNTLADIFRDLARIVLAQIKGFRARATQFIADLTQQIKELPVVAMLQEKLQELAVPDQVIAVLQQVHSTFRELLPTEETKAFADALFKYVEKKLHTDKPVNDEAELRVIYEKLTAAIASLVQLIRAQVNQLGLQNVGNISPDNIFHDFQGSSLPAFNGDASFNLLEQLLQGDLPDAEALLRAYRVRSFNPLEEVPAKLHGVVVNGQHLFTFDGRHLTFPGTCRYILAHDYVDRNFTFVLQLQNGQPKGLALIDKSGKFVELKDNGQVALNGAIHGYPIIEDDIFAFKTTRGVLGIGSRYGVMAFCSPQLEVCYLEVSGFYHGKLRGLLGDGNNEPFDDFTMPNGKISTSEPEFANAYRLATSCAVVKPPAHSEHQLHASLPAACEQVFGASSTLRPLGLVMDIGPFRQACIHAVAGAGADSLKQACDLGRGLAALALANMLPAVVPPTCLQCTDVAGGPKQLGDTYEVKVPSNQADIVVTVETTVSNSKNYKDIATPLVAQIVSILKSKHIDDIKVYVVGISPKYPYPIVYDTDLKLSQKVEFDDKSRYEHTPIIRTDIPELNKYQEFVTTLFDGLRNQFGLTNVDASYESVMDLPLRPAAVKHALNVVGDTCDNQNFLLEFVRIVAFDVYLSEVGYTHSIIAPTPLLELSGGKKVGEVVGFTEEKVIMLNDKKVGQEAEALRPLLNNDNDVCVDFVEETNNGLVLSATNYHELPPAQQKQYLQTAAAAITRQMLEATLVQECICQYVDPFNLRSLCTTTNKLPFQVSRRK